MTETKLRILEVSRILFNEEGLSSTRLQQIADACKISVGNLAYHFSTKEVIAEKLIEQASEELMHLLKNYGKAPSMEDISMFIHQYLLISFKYSFLIKGSIELKNKFSESHRLITSLLKKCRLQLFERLNWMKEKSLLIMQTDTKVLSFNLWVLLNYGSFYFEMDDESSNDSLIRAEIHIWQYLFGHLTETGIKQVSDVMPFQSAGKDRSND